MTTQVTFNNFNVGERKNGQIPAELITILVWKWIINSIVPNTYLEIHIPHPAQILKSRSCACFPQHQTIPPKRCQDWFLQMFHSPCPSQCTVATSSCKSSSLFCNILTMLFTLSIPVFSHTQLNGNPSEDLHLPSSSQSCLYLSVIAVPCCLQSERRGSAMNCSVIKVNIRAPFESLIFNISRTWWGEENTFRKMLKHQQ